VSSSKMSTVDVRERSKARLAAATAVSSGPWATATVSSKTV
jgi:hypothetical protein